MAPVGTSALLKRALENLRISGPRTLLLASSINPSSSATATKNIPNYLQHVQSYTKLIDRSSKQYVDNI